MARITVEDCLAKVPNRFELVSLASKRAKDIIRQRGSLLEGYRNRPVVMSLREIAQGRVWPKYD